MSQVESLFAILKIGSDKLNKSVSYFHITQSLHLTFLHYPITFSSHLAQFSHFHILSPQHASPDAEQILIGNKCDLENERRVHVEEGEKLAAEIGIPFLEASAKTNHNVDKVKREGGRE